VIANSSKRRKLIKLCYSCCSKLVAHGMTMMSEYQSMDSKTYSQKCAKIGQNLHWHHPPPPISGFRNVLPAVSIVGVNGVAFYFGFGNTSILAVPVLHDLPHCGQQVPSSGNAQKNNIMRRRSIFFLPLFNCPFQSYRISVHFRPQVRGSGNFRSAMSCNSDRILRTVPCTQCC